MRVPFPAIDWAGRIFYSRIFEFTQQALEDFLINSSFGSLPFLFKKKQPLPVVIHAEADYAVPIELNDQILIAVNCSHIGNTSFVMQYQIFRQVQKGCQYAATVKVVHVLIKNQVKKVAITPKWKKLLQSVLIASK